MSQHDTLTLEPTRADFERYFLESRKSKGANRKPTFERFEDGTYKDDHTQRHWWTWQNALATPSQAQQSIDAEALIRAVLPGGSSCDPQTVADEIRRYLGQWPGQASTFAEYMGCDTAQAQQSEPAKPLFASKVAARKWAELQDDGARMQSIAFDGHKSGQPGTIDPWGGVLWDQAQQAGEPYAYAVYFPDQPTEVLVHDLDELIDDMTNREHTVTKLYATTPPAPAQPAQPVQGVPDGWRLVPVEPTPEMKSAGITIEIYSEVSDSIGALTWAEVAAIYRAMLTAAPTPPAQQGEPT